MASTDEAKASTEEAPKAKAKLNIKQFLGTVSMSERDKWVVEKILAGNTDEKTATQWNKELNSKCKGITIKK